MVTAADLTKQGIAAHRAGDTTAAADLFRQATEADPSYEMAWLWRSSTAATDGEKRAYLELALAINPSSEPARRGLAKLGADVAVPPELAGPAHAPAPAPALPAPVVSTSALTSLTTDRELIAYVVADYTQRGWRVVSQTDTSVQLAEPKKLNPLGMVVFVMVPALIGCLAFLLAPGTGLLILGVAAIGLVLVLVDYALKKERLEFITVEQARQMAEQTRSKGQARVRKAGIGYACTACGGAVRPDAAECKHCSAKFSLA